MKIDSRASCMAAEVSNTKPGVEVAALTDVGRLRDNNEDAYLYWEASAEEEFRRLGRLVVIADGMGGYEGGQEASRLAVETVRHIYESNSNVDPQQTLINGLATAHQNIQLYAEAHPELTGMGTTCTALAIVGRQLSFAHVGDSRLYLIRPETVTRLTRDHSYVGRLVESGIVRSEDAEQHPQRHILTAALGSGRDVVPDAPEHSIPLENGDTLLLCTDGLWSLVPEQELARIARSHTPAQSCTQLVQLALDRGGPDNITVVMVRITS